MKVLWIIRRFAVAEDKMRKPTMAESRSGFLYNGNSQRQK